MIKQILRTYRQFNDLTESEKTACIEKHRYSFDDLTNILLSEQLENEILPILHDNGFLIDTRDIEYDLNYCQGRGACFYSKSPNLQYDLLFDGLEIPHKKWLFDIIDNYCEVELKKIDTYYSHENTVRFNLYFYDRGNTHSRIEKMLEKMSDYAEKKRYDLSCEICEKMTENWENCSSDEFIENELIENEYYFDDDLNIVGIDSIENEGAKNE